MDLRARVMAAVDEGEPTLEVAARFGVHDSWVRKLKRRRKRTGSIAPHPHGGGPERKIDAATERRLRALVCANNDATLEELRAGLAKEGKSVSITSIWRALARLGLTLKKKHSTRPSATPVE
jgi:transposase